MIAGVQLEDEHVIDARLPPAPRVDGEQERHQHEQEDSAVDSDGDLELGRRMVCVEPCEHRPDPTLPSTRTNQGRTVNKLSKSVCGLYVVGMGLVCGRYVVGMWSVCGRYVVGMWSV